MAPLSRRRFLRGSLALAGLGLLAGCGIVPLPAAPGAKLPRLGYLAPGSDAANPFHAAFLDGLRELGYVEGQSIAIEWRFAAGRQDDLPGMAADLVRLPVDVILAVSTAAVKAAKQATSSIPIVIANSGDPVAGGLVANLARPGANVTGLSSVASQLSGKRLELLKEILPGVSRVAVLWSPLNPATTLDFRETQTAAGTLGVQLQSLELRSAEDLEPAFEAATGARAEALIALQDPIVVGQRTRIADLAARSRLPAIHPLREFADAGGLMSYGPSLPAQFRRAAAYVDKILKGAKPADLPVEQPTTFDFVINLKTAQTLGLTIPQSMLQQATDVIQ